ncbi:MAG: hypothetical protein WA359_02275 [Acidimicrobiales bacterium]
MTFFARRAKAGKTASTATTRVINPLANGGFQLVHCGWVYDNSDDVGGFTAGEFLLRDDGALFIRVGSSTYDHGQTRYWFDRWVLDDRWEARGDSESCLVWMRSRGYSLYDPGPVSIDESEAGPFSGMPSTPRPLKNRPPG